MKAVIMNLPYRAPIVRQGTKRPLGIPAPYVQQAIMKYTIRVKPRVARVNAPNIRKNIH